MLSQPLRQFATAPAEHDNTIDIHDNNITLDSTWNALNRSCPEYVNRAIWRRAVADGGKFLAEWGRQAEALGWTARDLFGLAEIPEQPHHSFNRLARYDSLGLIWILWGKSVVALSANEASIRHKSGSITKYRKDIAK
jgi:hypothetical protein